VCVCVCEREGGDEREIEGERGGQGRDGKWSESIGYSFTDCSFIQIYKTSLFKWASGIKP
jgi:hypothetical protein